MALLVLLIVTLIWWNDQRQIQAAPDAMPAILFSKGDAGGVEQLYLLDLEWTEDELLPAAGAVRQATGANEMVWDFAVRPDGQSIVYSVLTAADGADLWQLTTGGNEPSLLMACSPSACNGPSWSPDGAFLGFSQRRGTDEVGGVLAPPRPWIRHMESGETAALLTDDQELGFDVRWSDDNRWAAYVSPVQGEIALVDLTNGERRLFASGTGEPVAWRPGHEQFLFTRIIQVDDVFVPHLFLSNATDDQAVDLSLYDPLVEDRNPAWSADGEWIALRRKTLTGENATRGSQIWLMRADGSDARALTHDPDADYSPPRWSPDGRFLVYRKMPLKGPDLETSIWVTDVENGESSQMAKPGQRPEWIAGW